MFWTLLRLYVRKCYSVSMDQNGAFYGTIPFAHTQHMIKIYTLIYIYLHIHMKSYTCMYIYIQNIYIYRIYIYIQNIYIQNIYIYIQYIYIYIQYTYIYICINTFYLYDYSNIKYRCPKKRVLDLELLIPRGMMVSEIRTRERTRPEKTPRA